MSEVTHRPAIKDYTAALEAYLGSAGEFALDRAYELGRRAVSEGMSVLQFSQLHHEALRAVAAAPGALWDDVLTRGEQFFHEGLTVFEMALRAHRANVRLLGLSEALARGNPELSRARAQLRALLDATGAVVSLKDADGRFLFVNGAFEQLFGVSEARVLGKSVHEFVEGPNAALLQRDDARVLEARRPVETEKIYQTAQGPRCYHSLELPLVDPSHGVYALCSIASDVTQEQSASEKLSVAREVTDAANRQLESLTRALADELLAPLRSIDGFTQALLEDCGSALDDSSRAHLSNVRQSAQRMATLIDSLLALSRLSRGELRSREVDLTDLARDVAAQLRQAEPQRDVSFQIQPGLRAHGDPRLFGAVLHNLLGNSWKFTRPREHAEIVVGASSERGTSIYYVRDNGTGFDMAHSGKLFSVFETLHSRREFGGNGLGLATVQRIVNRHGGRVWAEAAVGRGATFYFTLGEQLS